MSSGREEFDRAGDRMTAQARSGRSMGGYVLIPEEMTSQVFDAAKLADYSPPAFVRNAVETALGVDDPQISVLGMDHPQDSGHVALSSEDWTTAKQFARQQDRDMSVDEWVQAAVRNSVRQTKESTGVPQREANRRQARVLRSAIPAPDPLGVVEQATGGMVRDPLRVMMENQQQGR